MPATAKRSALDADVPTSGPASDAYEVACTAAMLAGRPAAFGGGIFAPTRHAITLHRLSGKLHRIAERSCNGYHDEADEKRDERAEARALRDAAEIATHYGCRIYHQGDPRGCSLYLIPEEIVPDVTRLGEYVYTSDPPSILDPTDKATATKLQSRWIASNYDRGHAVTRLGR